MPSRPPPRYAIAMIRLRAATLADAPLLRRWDAEPHVIAAKTSPPAEPAAATVAAPAAGPTAATVAAPAAASDAEPAASVVEDDWSWDVELTRFPTWRELLIAEHDGHPIAFLQLIDPALEDTHYWGPCAPDLRDLDIWIGEATYLDRGHGTEIMRQALARCFAPPSVTAVIIDPLVTNHRARRFYERLGFEHLEDRTFTTDHCAVYQLTRARWLAFRAAAAAP